MSLPSQDGWRGIRADLEKLAVEDSALTVSLETALADERLNQKPFAQLLQAHSSAIHQRISLMMRWMDQIDSRVNEIESRLCDLANHASDQDETLNMMCSVLKEIDDPYGYGRSLDERILGDADNGLTEETDD